MPSLLPRNPLPPHALSRFISTDKWIHLTVDLNLAMPLIRVEKALTRLTFITPSRQLAPESEKEN